MDTQPFDPKQQSTPAPKDESPQQSGRSSHAGVWVALWVAIFVPLISTTGAGDRPEALLWTGIIIASALAIGGGLYWRFKKRA
jgi:LPXTG-motif cell wall-anchored protein